jgi:hypothetical protein
MSRIQCLHIWIGRKRVVLAFFPPKAFQGKKFFEAVKLFEVDVMDAFAVEGPTGRGVFAC